MTSLDWAEWRRRAIPGGGAEFLLGLPASFAGLPALAACGGGSPPLAPSEYTPPPAPPPRVEVSIPDANLRAAVEARLEKESGATIYVDEMEAITNPDAPKREMKDLRGLESAETLTKLDLARNDISYLSPLSDLTALEHLNLHANDISDLAPHSDLGR